MARLVLIASTPRAGSNRLVEAFDAFENVAAFAEVFSPQKAFLFSHQDGFEDHLVSSGQLRDHPSDATLTNWMRSDPVRATQAMLDYADVLGKEIAVYKVFRGHIMPIDLLRIVRRFRPAGFVLHRDPLASYISSVKAHAVGKWMRQDTTDIRPEIDYGDFVLWRRTHEAFLRYAYTSFVASACPRHVVDYDRFYSGSVTPEEYLAAVFGEWNLDAGGAAVQEKKVIRQDRADRLEDKVENWAAFTEAATTNKGPSIDVPYDVSFSSTLLLRSLAGHALRSIGIVDADAGQNQPEASI